jgi:hypothetical protein
MRPQTPFLAFQQELEIENIGKDAEHRTAERVHDDWYDSIYKEKESTRPDKICYRDIQSIIEV